jgi:hypothetical protein
MILARYTEYRERMEIQIEFLSETLKERDRLGGVQLRITLKCNLDRPVMRIWTGLIWLRVGNSGAGFYMRDRTLGFLQKGGNFLVS